MTLAYLGHRPWSDISREERLFCAELFFEIRDKEKAFVRWLASCPGMNGLVLETISRLEQITTTDEAWLKPTNANPGDLVRTPKVYGPRVTAHVPTVRSTLNNP